MLNETGKYTVTIGNGSQGVVIGDGVKVQQNFFCTDPTTVPFRTNQSLPSIPRDRLLAAIHQAGAELRAYPNKIAGIHLDRVEVAQIVEWALSADSKKRLGMLLDQPGGGKTVVMRDVLERLEAENVPVLAIKADTLSGVQNRADLADRLGLPALVADCVRSLAADGALVVLLDQLDALSLTLSRDQATLDVMLSTLAHLCDMDNVCIIASCRTFDLNNDPRLSTIEVDHSFRLQPLDASQINPVLFAIGIEPARLLPGHRALLAAPLNLEVYTRVVAGDASQQPPESFYTLQELYQALWRKRIMATPPDIPRPGERIAAIERLVETMQTQRQLAASLAVLDPYPEAASYLEQVGFIRQEKHNWLFIHQTLFDYCYARSFVAQGKPLSREILSGTQGLFERSQMVQVLAHLRGSNETMYQRELDTLLFADGLRAHLRLLLIGWFGSLPNPTADELRIARKLMRDANDQVRFLHATSANTGWFDRLDENVLPGLLRTDDVRLLDATIRYLRTLIQHRTNAILAHLRPHLGQSEAWDTYISFCLSGLDDWQNEVALEMLSDLLQRGRMFGREGMCFAQLAQSNPAAGCRALRVYLDYRLGSLPAQTQTESIEWLWRREKLLGEYGIDEIMKQSVKSCPAAILEHLLPWFVRAATALTHPQDRPQDEDECYPSDMFFSWGWYDDHIQEGASFAKQIAGALRYLARTQASDFKIIATALATTESQAIHRVLAQAYLVDPQIYADDIYEYLHADARRLDIGDSGYDSCLLYGAAFQHVDAGRRAILEQLVLNLRPAWEKLNSKGRGITQLRFLKSVPPNLLSETALRQLQELEHKFPGFELHPPQGSIGGWIGPPIEQAAQAKMSDGAWLGAMHKYNDSGYTHPDFLKGGVRELASSFAKQVEADPERFYQLAQRFDESISLHYVMAAISGLSDSNVPAEGVFDLVRKFAPRIKGEFRRGICWALSKRAEAGVPDDLLNTLTEWALHDPDPAQELWNIIPQDSQYPYHNGNPHDHGINSNRGAAIRAVSRCAMLHKPPQVERAFQVLEQTANDPSTAVRTCVIESLGTLLNQDNERALAIFERTMADCPHLLQSPLVHRFLYWTYYHHFQRTKPFIEALLANDDDITRQAGARLACLAAFKCPEAQNIEKQALQGDTAMRRGAAEVYARNLGHPEIGEICRKRLLQLIYDLDEQVRKQAGECFAYLCPEHLDSLRSFIQEFLASPALIESAEYLVRYIGAIAADEHELTLNVTALILNAAGAEIVDMRSARSVLERDLARLPLAVYTHAFDPAIKSQAMDLFDRLLLLGSWTARQALEDWDRR